MSWLKKVLGSTIGLKLAVAVSGLGLVGFLIGHLYGNLQLFTGGTDGLDTYAEHLHALPGFTLIELGLLAMFVVHIPLVVLLARANRSARPQRYGVSASKRRSGKLMGMASRMMPLSGLLLLIFLVVHVSDFRRERAEFHQADGSVFGLGIEVVEALSNPLLALYQLHYAGFGAVVGHIGFDKMELGPETAIDSHAYAHYLHHKHFEVNFGDGLVPLDKLFGSWHDGSPEGERRMQARYEKKKARANAAAIRKGA